MLTPKDLENPKRPSGYDHVAGPKRDTRPGRVEPHPYYARAGAHSKKATTYELNWNGARKTTALEAAQDYCDYVNSGKAPQPKPQRIVSPPKPALNLNRANHPKRTGAVTEGPKTTEARVARSKVTVARSRYGFVYLIGVKGHADYVKIGWSAKNGFPRLNELQTGNPLLLIGLAEKPGTLQDEYNLHSRYEFDNVLNEWFMPSIELLAEFDYTWNAYCAAVEDLWSIDISKETA